VNAGLVEMAVRRLPDSVEIEISGVGAGPQLLQTTRGSSWEGRLLVATPTTLRRGPQRFSLPEAGLQSISIDGAGNRFALMVTPLPGYPVGRPVVSADGSNLILSFAAPSQPTQQSFGRDLSVPGRVPQPDLVPPLQARAVAPPVGDMAVGSIMLANTGFVNVSGPPVSMTLSNAPVQQVLMLLAKLGGYGLVFVNDQAGSSSQTGASATPQAATATGSTAPQNRPISIAFRNESYGRAVNSSLMAAGLQGKLEGNTLLVGPSVLGKGFGAQLSKVYRLNQVGANSAADYLANLGARVSKTNTTTTAISQGVPQSQQVNQGSTTNTTQSSTTTTVDSYGSDTGPLLGLKATTDSRLSSITLVGSPALVAVAETYLRQLDLRQRQVALSVKILDVTLDNDTAIENSFALRYGNNFIVNDRGQLLGAFGGLLSPRGDQFDILSGGASSAKPVRPEIKCDAAGNCTTVARDPINPLAAAPVNPGAAYPKDTFFDFVRASIESRSTKVLASPTLILTDNPEVLREGAEQSVINQGLVGGQPGGSGGSTAGSAAASGLVGRTKANEAFVTVGEQVITSYVVVPGQNGAPNSCQPTFTVAGLSFGARVNKIDDNGFVTFSMTPTISATTRTLPIPNCGPVDILSIRSLDTGSARVRDGQTLILTGVISDLDAQVVSKWPILGDIPIVGQFFRDTAGSRRKRELVIMVTPRIIDDTQGGTWGYGFQPGSRDTRRFLGTSSGQSPY
jgi:type IV pilus assembly protein PilQ